MPFVFTYNIPDDAPDQLLWELRRRMVSTLVTSMGVDLGWCGAFFPTDKLKRPVEPADGCSTIYVHLDTGMFYRKKGVTPKVQQVTADLGNIVSAAFGHTLEVEVFVDPLRKDWKALVPPAEQPPKLTQFTFEGVITKVNHIQTEHLRYGVTADIYHPTEHPGDWDLAIIHVQPGCRTPRQLINNGVRTVEGYISGQGEFHLTDAEGHESVSHDFVPPLNHTNVAIGETMMWKAEPNSELVAFEVCIPPWTPDRYTDLD